VIRLDPSPRPRLNSSPSSLFHLGSLAAPTRSPDSLTDPLFSSHASQIQRLVTPERLQRRRHLRSLKRRKTEAQKAQKAEYEVVVAKRLAERKQVASAVKAKKAAARSA